MKKLLLPILLFSQFSYAQIGLWSDAGITKKWNKKQQTTYSLGERQNIGVGFDRLFFDLNHQYQVYDGIQIVGAYRIALNEKGDQLRLQTDLLSHRFQIGMKVSILDLLDFGPKRLELTWLSRQQWGFQVGKPMGNLWRNRLSLSYDIKNSPFSPCISAEHFYSWNTNTINPNTGALTNGSTIQWRYFMGFGIELPQKQSLKFQFGFRNRASGSQALLRASYAIQL